MDILLINPFSWVRDGRPPYLPYGILYLAGYLKSKGIKVSIFDCNLELTDPLETVKKLNPSYVGFSVLSGPVIKDALDTTKRIKKYDKKIKTIWGGLHPSIFPKYTSENENIDFTVVNEGEKGILEIVTGKNTDRINRTGADGNFINLNTFHPAWDLVDTKRYIANRSWGSRVLTMNTSRGCIFKCAFCYNQAIEGQKWRAVSADMMVEQIKFLKDKYKINGIQFYEDLFDVDRDRVRAFCHKVKPLNITWEHFSAVTLANQELLDLEYSAGCRHIAYGVESGSERILKFIHKQQKVSHIKEAFIKCKKANISASALFMIGLPTETKDDLDKTIELINSLESPSPICTIYRPYPATPLYDWCVKNRGFSEPKTLDEQADFYSYGKLANYIENVSDVSTETLDKIQATFLKNLMIKEILTCFKTLNIERIIYHIKYFIKENINILFKKELNA